MWVRLQGQKSHNKVVNCATLSIPPISLRKSHVDTHSQIGREAPSGTDYEIPEFGSFADFSPVQCRRCLTSRNRHWSLWLRPLENSQRLSTFRRWSYSKVKITVNKQLPFRSLISIILNIIIFWFWFLKTFSQGPESSLRTLLACLRLLKLSEPWMKFLILYA